MNKIKQNSGWLYAVLFVVSVLPLFWWWQNGLLYMGKILLIQILALAGSILMFRKLYENPLAVLLGVTLYVTSPWRMDLCYVQNQLMLSVVWALVPFYLYGVLCVKEKGCRERKGMFYTVFAAIILAVIGCGSDVMLCLLAALTLLLTLIFKRITLLLSVAGGGLLWGIGNVDFVRYLFTDYAADFGVPIQSITPKGYVFIDFLTSYTYMDGKPGLGLGLLITLALYVFVCFVRGKKTLSKEGKVLGAIGVLSLLLATKYFPWELVQRLGGWALKFVSLLDTPGLFVGFAALLLPVIGVSAVDVLEREEERLPAMGSLVMCWMAAVGIAVYLCYMLVRSPIFY